MLRAMIENMLGPAGVQVLHFYEANSLAINIVVVMYGLIMVLAWSNLVTIRRRLVSGIVSQLAARPDIKAKQVLSEISIPWEMAIHATRFPLVARRMALWPQHLTVNAIQDLLPPEELVGEALQLLRQHTTQNVPARRLKE